ncbi:Rne/Rng family ribonuclease [Candidatus Sumerlaeota bacterium]|nr:Rne/Rng family ribonuclease [Candidatus Sumerlaeota bacterium]
MAVVEEGVLTDLFIENRHEKTIVGNIYKGIVADVIPGIQAAFIDIGLERNAFLHVQDIPPAEGDEPFKLRGRRRRNGNGSGGEGKPMNISDYLKPGQKIMVQAIKDGIGDKGPRISQFISLPGRSLVLLPNQGPEESGGVSRKIEDSRERARLKRLLDSLEIKDGTVILRTAAVENDDESIRADADFLVRTWGRIQAKCHTAKAPTLLHTDFDILYRLVRDVFTDSIEEIFIDDTAEHANLVKMLRQFLPKLKNRVLLYPSTRNIFEVFDVERQIYKALRRRVWLRSGGHVVIDECEALCAVDVNTGKFIGKEDQEATVLRTNLEAARVIARQLRLRDIGGIIIIDFIDMKRREHREEVVRDLKRCLRFDRARTTVSDFTNLGIVEMTRKRVRHSLRKTLQRPCMHCGGDGMILEPSSVWRVVRNAILTLIEDHSDHRITARVHPEILEHIRERHMGALHEIEDEHGIQISLEESSDIHQERYTLIARPADSDEENGKDEIVVVGKRFSGAELDETPAPKPSRRRTRGGRGRKATTAEEPASEVTEEDETSEQPEIPAEEDEAQAPRRSSRRRRGSRGGRRRRAATERKAEAGVEATAEAAAEGDEPEDLPVEEHSEEMAPPVDDEVSSILAMESLSGRLAHAQEEEVAEETPRKRSSRRRPRGGRGRRRVRFDEPVAAEEVSEAEASIPVPEGSPAPPEISAPEAEDDFRPVEEYLDETPEGEEPRPEAPVKRRAAAKRKAGAKTKATTAKKKTATRRKAASKTKGTAAKKTASKRATRRRASATSAPEE